jgi:putative transposase
MTRYRGLGTPEIRELRQLREENKKIKQLVADLTLDKHILQKSLEKVLRPGERRPWVEWARAVYQVSVRRACLVGGFSRSSIVYRSRRPPQEALRRRIRELAAVRISYGYRRLHVLLRREGWPINAKRVYRLYLEEGLGLKRKKPKRRRAATARQDKESVTRPNERWAMDFMHDMFFDGRKLWVLTVINVFTRECLALKVRQSFRGEHVAEVLSDLVARRGKPQTIQCDQGTEFTSMALDHWAYWNQIGLSFSRPGRPGDNARNEAFNGLVRRECLWQHYFLDRSEAAGVLDS